MVIFDIIIAVILVVSIISGFRKGLIIQLTKLVALIAGVCAAFMLSSYVAEYIEKVAQFDSTATNILAFCITLVGVWALVYATGKFVEQAIKIALLGFINRILGGAFSLLKALLVLGLLILIADGLNEVFGFYSESTMEKSFFYTTIHRLTSIVFPYIYFGELVP